jgi:hypothetical protein
LEAELAPKVSTICESFASMKRSCVSAPAWPPVVVPQETGSAAVGVGAHAEMTIESASNLIIASL